MGTSVGASCSVSPIILIFFFFLVSSTSVHVFVPVFVFMASCRKEAYYLRYKCVYLVFSLEDREAN